jgi:hypothetical protein
VDLNTFIVGVFYLTDNWMLSQEPVRRRGPNPKLSDSEVITMEIVGEFLGIDTDTRASTPTSSDTTEGGFSEAGRSPPHHLHKTSGQPLEGQREALAAHPPRRVRARGGGHRVLNS